MDVLGVFLSHLMSSLLQRHQNSQFYFSDLIADEHEMKDAPKVKIHPIDSIALWKQPKLRNIPKVSKKPSKKPNLYCSFAPIATEGNYSIQDITIPTDFDYLYDGHQRKNDVLFDIDAKEDIHTKGVTGSVLEINSSLIKQCSDNPSDSLLLELLESNLVQMVKPSLYTKKQIRDCMKRIKQFDVCYKGVGGKCESKNQLGME
jgi:hypothetical protein